ncbi:glucosylglycerol 3-phosphatase [Pseudomonas sp.]|uniref:glucosylglycerol 3-phosphatase n=1 Tax=Pseudomonas sp. TaxID=306 RepID=UPI0027311E8C|nr:glucosylglycerol 3-phosphatase [Pseudomonas sp.]MDP2242890.1 glucosylglycerol 3-phosphatase [Pseudomonas sp.]
MTKNSPHFSLDHSRLLDSLVATDKLLIIQDLDGVCMGLARDPLTRTIESRYVHAANQLAGHFFVLTNGEHIGRRGVNNIVDNALDAPAQAREQGLYLPGLAAGGVQLQDRYGSVSHPGVSEAELTFLRTIPGKAEHFLRQLLAAPPYALDACAITPLVDASVLDNLASPTININSFYQHFSNQPALYLQVQQAVAGFMEHLQQQASACQLRESFFVHYAPNLGSDDLGQERIKYSTGENAGTTDFQFMLKGAIKEVGVLLILNHYYYQHTGHYPLGADFNARQAPREHSALLQLARERFDPAQMPRIVGVGDTITSSSAIVDGQTRQLRGGSDRGFLTLVQALGKAYYSNNCVLYIDSSGDEVDRPGLNAAHLQRRADEPNLAPWPAAEGISDPADPLGLDVVFCGGHAQYVAFFCTLAQRHSERSR